VLSFFLFSFFPPSGFLNFPVTFPQTQPPFFSPSRSVVACPPFIGTTTMRPLRCCPLLAHLWLSVDREKCPGFFFFFVLPPPLPTVERRVSATFLCDFSFSSLSFYQNALFFFLRRDERFFKRRFLLFRFAVRFPLRRRPLWRREAPFFLLTTPCPAKFCPPVGFRSFKLFCPPMTPFYLILISFLPFLRTRFLATEIL